MSPRRLVRLLAGITLLAALGTQVAGLDAGVLHLAPAFLLVLPLICGRYVGEQRIAELAAVAPRPSRLRGSWALQARLPRPPRALAARGGRLIAWGLAERGPPPAPAAAG